uniref:Putative secreted protein n=1 Tax=Anopheles marajoara TaxID=58244 RepID=A0A2M4BZ40_9DIPT
MAIQGRISDIGVVAVCLLLGLTLIAHSGMALPAGAGEAPRNTRNSTDLFAYPAEQSVIESKQNARNRTPIYIPGGCAEDEIFYPGDHENDWVCDCKPTYIYHPSSQRCYQLYTKGNCESGQMVYIEPNGKYPRCVRNECPDGQVMFMKQCVVLNQEHQLCDIARIKLVVGINERTHMLECVNISDVHLNKTMLATLEKVNKLGSSVVPTNQSTNSALKLTP